MCLNGDLETMIEVLNALNDARLQLVQWRDVGSWRDGGEMRSIQVTQDEGLDIFLRRIAALELRCRELGIHGPAPKADPGDQRRIVDAK